MVSYDEKGKCYFVDCASISSTIPDDVTPKLSMKQIEEQMHS
jgi:hypothetical protein